VDLQDFERIEESFRQFHAALAPAFGRKQWRERSRDYLRGLLAQAQERGNAENLAEAVEGASPRVLQRFLTEAPWDAPAVLAALQQYLGPRLNHPEAVWAVDDSGFPKQGKKSVGVAHQYCGPLGKVAGCQVGVFLAHVGPRGRALVAHRLFLPEEWTDDPARCTAAGVPAAEQRFQKKTEIALALLGRAQAAGGLRAEWVTGDDHYGQSPEFREGVAEAGLQYVLEVPGHLTVWPEAPQWEQRPYSGLGRPPKLRPIAAQRQEIRARKAALPAEAWEEMAVGEGAQGTRTYRFAFERVSETRHRQPGAALWLIHKENWDGTEPRSFFSNAPADTPKAVLARVAMSRWPIETEFEDEKSQVALDEYEVRSWAGWHHHVTMSLLASAFLLTLQQDWKKKAAPGDATPGVPGRVRTLAQEALERRGTAGVAGGNATPECSRWA
jgi:SRSO17 transposase